MLPLLQLDFRELCQSALDFNRLNGIDNRSLTDVQIEARCRAWTGESYAYRDEQLRQESVSTAQNLDQILSGELVLGFTTHPVKRTGLIWLGRRFNCVILTVCDSRGQLCPEWMYSIPGYLESGRDFVGLIDKPYAYWDGHNLHRLYPRTRVASENSVLVCDFGNGFGWTVEARHPDHVLDQVLENDPEYWEYSCIPSSKHEEIVTVRDTRCVLLRSFYEQA
jgi:hypothetical protein